MVAYTCNPLGRQRQSSRLARAKLWKPPLHLKNKIQQKDWGWQNGSSGGREGGMEGRLETFYNFVVLIRM
jgi:hypothetical protein